MGRGLPPLLDIFVSIRICCHRHRLFNLLLSITTLKVTSVYKFVCTSNIIIIITIWKKIFRKWRGREGRKHTSLYTHAVTTTLYKRYQHIFKNIMRVFIRGTR